MFLKIFLVYLLYSFLWYFFECLFCCLLFFSLGDPYTYLLLCRCEHSTTTMFIGFTIQLCSIVIVEGGSYSIIVENVFLDKTIRIEMSKERQHNHVYSVHDITCLPWALCIIREYVLIVFLKHYFFVVCNVYIHTCNYR